MKSSLWTCANIASTVCVSDDASCEKIRLSLENCEVEKDIVSFIKDRGTGQEIPDPPKYINFCRGDVDTQSEASEDDNYSVAQFQRTINPAYRSSSPQPSTYESHHDPQSALAQELGHDISIPRSREATVTPQKAQVDKSRQAQVEDYEPQPSRQPKVEDYEPPPVKQLPVNDYQSSPQKQRQLDYQAPPSRQQLDYQPPNPRRSSQPQQHAPQPLRTSTDHQSQSRQPQLDYRAQSGRQPHPDYQSTSSRQPQLEYKPQLRQTQTEPQKQPQQQAKRFSYEQSQHGPLAAVPHDPFPLDGMTMLCRTGPPSERSSAHSPIRPSSRDSQSEYSNPTSFSSQEPPSGKQSPVKQVVPPAEKQVLKKKSGFFQAHSPFRRKSNKDKDHSTAMTPSNRNTWSARTTTGPTAASSTTVRRPQAYAQGSQSMISDRPSGSPEPIDPRASFQLNVGNNVFDVAAPESKKSNTQKDAALEAEELDPIAQALAELKGVVKPSSSRMSADKYHGVPTPAPGSTPSSRPAQITNGALMAGMRGTPPPSYDQPVQRLGLPQPAFTSKAMQQTRQKYVEQTQNIFSPPSARPDSAGYGSGNASRPGTRGSDMPRATSPAPPRSVSPHPNMQVESRPTYRSASPNPASPRGAPQVDSRQAYRSASPNPYAGSQRSRAQSSTPQKRGSDSYYRQNSPNDVARAVSPAPFRDQERPSSTHVSDMSMQMQLAPGPDEWAGSQSGRGSRAGGSASSRAMSYYGGSQGDQQLAARQRSKSVADVRQYNREGRPILHFGKYFNPC